MIINCRYCKKEFDKPSHRNQHERDAHAPVQSASPADQGATAQTIKFDERHLRNLIRKVSNAAFHCGEFNLEPENAEEVYQQHLDDGSEAEKELISYVTSLVASPVAQQEAAQSTSNKEHVKACWHVVMRMHGANQQRWTANGLRDYQQASVYEQLEKTMLGTLYRMIDQHQEDATLSGGAG